jgi:hypothetical protein
VLKPPCPPDGFNQQKFHLGVHTPQIVGRPLLHRRVQISVQAEEKPFLLTAQ